MTTARFAKLTPEIESDWDALVEASPDGWPFALSRWQRLILAVEEWGLEDHSFALYDQGKLQAVMPLQFSKATGLMASSGWGGSGPVVELALAGKYRSQAFTRTFRHAESVAVERGASRLEFSTSPVTRSSLGAHWGVNPFVFFGYDDLSSLSQVVDLSLDESDLWKQLSELARRSIRRARSAGYQVEMANWREMVDRYYEVHCETYTRTGVMPHPKSYFHGIAEELSVIGHSVLWTARNRSNEAVAFHNSLRFTESAYYHTGCSTNVALEDGANYLLFWEALVRSKAQGIRWYDCGWVFPGVSGDKRAGLTAFKTKFGGEPHRAFKSVKTLLLPSSVEQATSTPVRSNHSKLRRKLAALLGKA